MASPAALDTTIAVVTPENIAFDYQLAGPFRRLPAYLIDLGVRWGVIIIVVICLSVAGLLASFSGFGSFVIASGFILYFLISWFYGTVLETYFNGRTIGKWACGIRVIDTDGRPITGKRAMLRNLLRIADLAPPVVISSFATEAFPIFVPTGMVGLLTMICTRRMQRLGDLAAGTMVIVDERGWRLPVAKVDDPRVPALASFFPGDYRVSRSMAKALAIYAERRHYLTPARRREISPNPPSSFCWDCRYLTPPAMQCLTRSSATVPLWGEHPEWITIDDIALTAVAVLSAEGESVPVQ